MTGAYQPTQRPPPATTCPNCGYTNGGAFTVCPICKRDVHQLAHPGDRAVGHAALACSAIALFLMVIGAA